MRKATFIMSALSFVASVATLGVVAFGVKKVHGDVEDIRKKSNEAIKKLKVAIVDFQI